MDFDNQIVISIVLAFAMFIALAPVIILDKAGIRLSLTLLIVGIILLPISAAWAVFTHDTTFIKALLLQFEGGVRYVSMSYTLILSGFFLVTISLLKKALTSSSSGTDNP